MIDNVSARLERESKLSVIPFSEKTEDQQGTIIRDLTNKFLRGDLSKGDVSVLSYDGINTLCELIDLTDGPVAATIFVEKLEKWGCLTEECGDYL